MSTAIGQSILVVETDPLQRASTSEILLSAGFRVMSASNFDDAKRLLAADPPELLITGLRLGEFNGLHLVLRSRTERPEMCVIVTSEFGDKVLEAEVARQNAAFLIRPNGGQILSAVNGSLKNHVHRSSL